MEKKNVATPTQNWRCKRRFEERFVNEVATKKVYKYLKFEKPISYWDTYKHADLGVNLNLFKDETTKYASDRINHSDF